MSRALVVVGIVIVLIGLAWPWIGRAGPSWKWLGRLPGDIVIRHGNFTVYAPIATALVISVALSLILWLINR